MNRKHPEKRGAFSGKLGYVLSAAGASVGLGNIWRFPYLAAKYGGGIFLLVYILLALQPEIHANTLDLPCISTTRMRLLHSNDLSNLKIHLL